MLNKYAYGVNYAFIVFLSESKGPGNISTTVHNSVPALGWKSRSVSCARNFGCSESLKEDDDDAPKTKWKAFNTQ